MIPLLVCVPQFAERAPRVSGDDPSNTALFCGV